ncbi:Protein of unknown function [Gryllus bimaculatus]|nr:Protein of unknown function [Gryllus bimaculatus]
MDKVKAAVYKEAIMEKAQNDIRLATKIIGLVTARIQGLRKKKPDLQVKFCVLGDALQNYAFDTFILRVNWNKSGIQNKNIYLCVTPKQNFQSTENLTDSEADVIKILQISFSLYEQFQDISKIQFDTKLSQIVEGVGASNFSLVLYTTSNIRSEYRVQVPANNCPIIGTFETKKNGGFCLSAQHDVVKNAFPGRDQFLLCNFLSSTVFQDARIEAPDVTKLLKNSLQDNLWALRDWPHGNTTMEKYLRHIEEMWSSRTILQGDSTKLHDIVRRLINAQHLVVPTDHLAAMEQRFKNHDLTYVIVPDVPPVLRCSRVKQVLERCCLKFLILSPQTLKEWRDDVLQTICQSPALCEELVLSVVSLDSDMKTFLQCVRGSGCRVRVVAPTWKKETHEFLQSLLPSYSSWVDKWSNTERGRLPALPLRRLPGGCGAHGALYETKMAALVALRARRRGLRFQLHVNVAAVRPWDDLVLRVEGPGPPATWLVQLKHAMDDGCLVSLQRATGTKARSPFLSRYCLHLEAIDVSPEYGSPDGWYYIPSGFCLWITEPSEESPSPDPAQRSTHHRPNWWVTEQRVDQEFRIACSLPPP